MNPPGATALLTRDRKLGTTVSVRTFVAVPPTQLAAPLAPIRFLQVARIRLRSRPLASGALFLLIGGQLPLIVTRWVLLDRRKLRKVVVVPPPPVPVGTLKVAMVPVVVELELVPLLGKVT